MELLIKQLEELISPNEWFVTNLSNASALLMDAIDDLSWVGFYMMRAGELVLGPFQGKIACTHIKVGKVIAVLDVDSNSLGRFGDKEQELFEALGKVLEKSLWSEKADV